MSLQMTVLQELLQRMMNPDRKKMGEIQRADLTRAMNAYH